MFTLVCQRPLSRWEKAEASFHASSTPFHCYRYGRQSDRRGQTQGHPPSVCQLCVKEILIFNSHLQCQIDACVVFFWFIVCFDIGSALFVVASQRISAEIIAVFIIDVALPRDRLLRDALAHSCLRGRGKAIWWNCSRVKSCY